jgi:leucyl/phenylalanyl-tRNA--protein transferase
MYGLLIGRVFFGESMFSAERDASKVAMAALVAESVRRDIALIDCQLPSPHLESLGCRPIPRSAFEALLAKLLGTPDSR